MKITIACTVLSFEKPTLTPPALEYSVWSPEKAWNADEELEYLQIPDCGYSYTGAYDWTGTNTNIAASGSVLTVAALDGNGGNAVSRFPIEITATLTITDAKQTGTKEFVVPGIVDFEVVIKNPCSESEGVTIDVLQFDYPTPTVEFG